MAQLRVVENGTIVGLGVDGRAYIWRPGDMAWIQAPLKFVSVEQHEDSRRERRANFLEIDKKEA